MTDINNAEFNAIVIRAIGSDTPEAKKRAVNEALALLYTTDTLKKWAQSISTGRGYRDTHGVHDIEQVIAEKVLTSLREATPDRSNRITDWLRFLHGLAVNAVKDYLASSQMTVASKMSGLVKRRDIIRRTSKELLAKTGSEPTRQEIIDAANAWAIEHHKDARKQGLLISEEDFAPAGMHAMSLDEEPYAGPATEGDAESSAEAQLALDRVRKVAEDLFPGDISLRAVVDAWVGCIAAAERPSQANIVKVTGLSATVVRGALANLNDVLDEVRDLFA
ncbi:hypothetical protein [Microbacterium sp. 77mftsu3.1]|uniref:hypothetical protein n=1 Tax=Microbacterium sp. 77mftsu3.1 TaxID=1761802 RepID=UPI000373D4F7|nr:hypothetical protein [Microbacterium sp. 77mftsu3.1]SDH34598.1 hypothetical protein SAMN04488590_3089 [Microbacterium sp. 77mftsu3.1]